MTEAEYWALKENATRAKQGIAEYLGTIIRDHLKRKENKSLVSVAPNEDLPH